MPGDHILLYDGACCLCSRLVKFVIRKDPGAKFHFASLQSRTGKQLLSKYGLAGLDLDTAVYIRGREYFLKSDAILQAIREFSFPWNWLYPLILVPRVLRNGVYHWLARHRYRMFGQLDSCMVPDENIRDRFLDWEEEREGVN